MKINMRGNPITIGGPLERICKLCGISCGVLLRADHFVSFFARSPETHGRSEPFLGCPNYRVLITIRGKSLIMIAATRRHPVAKESFTQGRTCIVARHREQDARSLSRKLCFREVVFDG
jgi:hypothetical protein